MAAERGCCENLLRRLFRLVNFLLILLGLAWIGYGLYLLKMAQDRVAEGAESKPSGFFGFWKPYWFIEVTIFCGVWICITSVCALLGTAMDNGSCIGIHTVMILISLLSEAALVVAIYANKNWDLDHLEPIDGSGKYEQFRDLVTGHLTVVLYFGLAVVILQSLALLMACGVWSLLKEKRVDESDDEGEIWKRRSLLPRGRESDSGAPQEATRQKREDPWRNRMREKYGLDTSKFTYDPEKTRSRAVKDKDRERTMHIEHEEKKGWCTVM